MSRRSENARLEKLADLLVEYARFDFSKKARTTEKGDEVDAIALGLNLMVEELVELREKEKKYLSQIGLLNKQLEKKVTERTGPLTASETKYRNFFQYNPVPMWVIGNVQFRFLDVNEAAIAHYGYSREEFMGMSAVDIRPKEQKERFLGLSRKTSPLPYDAGTWSHLKKDGTVIAVHVSASDIMFGDIPSRLVVSYDVTEQLKAREELKQSNKELETFIYRLSHDLRGPVASAKGLLKVMGAETAEEQTRKYTVMLETLAERQDYMLQNLLKVMKARGKKLQLSAVEPLSLVKQILSTLENTEGFGRIAFNITCDLEGPMHTDKELLYSILFNLVENGIKYQDRKIANPEINISIGKTQNNRVVMRIADNGIGIPVHEKEQVFDMFHRATDAGSGSGLGLYLVKNAMEKLNASITIEAPHDKGACFVLEFTQP